MCPHKTCPGDVIWTDEVLCPCCLFCAPLTHLSIACPATQSRCHFCSSPTPKSPSCLAHFVAIMITSCAFTAVTTPISWVFILGANSMKSKGDLDELVSLVGGYQRAPYLSFLCGLIMLFFGVSHWLLMTLNRNNNYHHYEGCSGLVRVPCSSFQAAS